MAISVVSTGTSAGNNNSTGASCSFTKSGTSGNLLIFLVTNDQGTVPNNGVSDDGTTPLTWNTARADFGADTYPGTGIYYAYTDAVNETITVSATTTGATDNWTCCVIEITGMASSSPIGTSGVNTGNSQAISHSITTGTANSWVFGALASAGSNAITVDSPSTEIYSKIAGTGNKTYGAGGRRTTTTTGSYNMAGSIAKSADNWQITLVEVKEAVAVPDVRLSALECDITYTEVDNVRVTALECDITYSEITNTVSALECDVTYDLITATVSALECDVTYTPDNVRISALECDITYSETGQSASDDFTTGTWPKTNWEDQVGWATVANEIIDANDTLSAASANSDTLSRRTDTWSATDQSCTVEWASGTYTGAQVAPWISAVILSQSDGSCFAAAYGGDASPFKGIKLYEISSGGGWTPRGSSYSTTDLADGDRVRITYDGTDIRVDWYNGSSWTNNVIVWTRTSGNSTGTPGLNCYDRTGDNAEISYWEASAGSVSSATVSALECDITYTEVDNVRITALECDVTYNAITNTISALEADITYDLITATVSALEADITYSALACRITALECEIGYYEPTVYPYQTSGRRLQDGYGNDIFLTGATPWHLFHRLSTTDRDTYLNDRDGRGCNAVIVSMMVVGSADYGDTEPIDNTDYQNVNGDAPFTDPDDYTTWNTDYFDHVESGIQKCLDLGMTVLLAPSYVGYGGSDQGWNSNSTTHDHMVTSSDADMTAFGNYIGKRFRKFPNIIWVHGCDRDIDGNATLVSRVNALQAAIASWCPFHLHTFHGVRNSTGRGDWTSPPSWIDIDTAYGDITNSSTHIKAAYDDTPTMPFVYFEGRYEDALTATAIGIRSQMYWALFGGAVGQFYGHEEVWNFQAWGSYSGPWTSYYQDTGAGDLQRFAGYDRADFNADWSNAILTAGYGTLGTSDYAIAAITDDNSLVMAYTPDNGQLTFTLTSMSEDWAIIDWINPSTGAVTNEGVYECTTGMNFTPPSAGDWLFRATATTVVRLSALECDITYDLITATVSALEADITYTASVPDVRVTALECDVTYDLITVTVSALEADITYDLITATVTALEADVTYTPTVPDVRVTALECDITYDLITATVSALETDITYDLITVTVTALECDVTYTATVPEVRITALECDVTFDAITATVSALEADITYDLITATVSALEADVTYTPDNVRVTALECDITYDLITVTVSALECDVTYDLITATVSALEADVTYTATVPDVRITALECDVTYTPTAIECRVTAIECDITYDLITATVSALEADITYDLITATVSALEADVTFDLITATVTALEADVTYTATIPDVRITALECDITYTPTPIECRVTALEADITYDLITVRLSAIECDVTYTPTPIEVRVSALEVDVTYDLITATVSALEADVTFDAITATVSALEADVTFDAITATVSALEADVTYDPITATVSALECDITYDLIVTNVRITALECDATITTYVLAGDYEYFVTSSDPDTLDLVAYGDQYEVESVAYPPMITVASHGLPIPPSIVRVSALETDITYTELLPAPSSSMQTGRTRLMWLPDAGYMGQDVDDGEGNPQLNTGSITASSAMKTAIANTGRAILPFSRCLTLTGQYAIGEYKAINPNWEYLMYIQFGHCSTFDPGVARALDQAVSDLLTPYIAKDINGDDLVAWRNGGNPAPAAVEAYWSHYTTPTDGAPINRALINAHLELLYDAIQAATHKPCGFMVDYMNPHSSGPYRFDGIESDLDYPSAGYDSDATQQARFAESQQYYLDRLEHWFGSSAIVLCNGRASWYGEEATIQSRMHGPFLEGFPTAVWSTYNDPTECFASLQSLFDNGGYKSYGSRLTPLFSTDLRPQWAMTGAHATLSRVAAMLYDGYWQHRPSMVESEHSDAAFDAIVSACGAPTGDPFASPSGDNILYGRNFTGGLLYVILDTTQTGISQFVSADGPGV